MLIVGLVAGTLSGIVGFGASIMLMPVLVIAFGPLQAVPIMAVASVLANFSRMLVWWREIRWRYALAFAITATPCAALGARTLLALPPRVIDIALGAFFIAMVPIRRYLASREYEVRAWHLAVAGALIGYVTGIVVSTGPISVPIFLATGLVKGAFLATEATASLAMYLSKAVVFRAFGALPLEVAIKGVAAGASLMTGSFLAKRFVLSMSAERFHVLMDLIMIAAGATMLVTAFT